MLFLLSELICLITSLRFVSFCAAEDEDFDMEVDIQYEQGDAAVGARTVVWPDSFIAGLQSVSSQVSRLSLH